MMCLSMNLFSSIALWHMVYPFNLEIHALWFGESFMNYFIKDFFFS